jgi:hypothetical protein
MLIKQLILVFKLLIFSDKKTVRQNANFIVSVISKAKSNYIYEKFLIYCDPEISFPLKRIKASFYGSGFGNHSLNTFRKIWLLDNEVLFEKIYLNYSTSLNNTLLIDNVFNKDKFDNQLFVVPKIKRKVKGQFFTIIYFEFLELREYPNRIELFKFNNLVISRINKLSISNAFENQIKILDFDSERMIKRRIDLINKIDLKYGIILKKILTIVGKRELVLSHGDLNHKNVFNNVVIDWDRLSYAPFGYDFGLNLAFNKLTSIHQGFNFSFVEKLVDKIYFNLNANQKLNIIFFGMFFSIDGYNSYSDIKPPKKILFDLEEFNFILNKLS